MPGYYALIYDEFAVSICLFNLQISGSNQNAIYIASYNHESIVIYKREFNL